MLLVLFALLAAPNTAARPVIYAIENAQSDAQTERAIARADRLSAKVDAKFAATNATLNSSRALTKLRKATTPGERAEARKAYEAAEVEVRRAEESLRVLVEAHAADDKAEAELAARERREAERKAEEAAKRRKDR